MNTKTIQAIDSIRSHFKALTKTAEGMAGFPGWASCGRVVSELNDAERELVCLAYESEPEEEPNPAIEALNKRIEANIAQQQSDLEAQRASTDAERKALSRSIAAEALRSQLAPMSPEEEKAFLAKVPSVDPSSDSARVQLLQDRLEAQLARSSK